MPISTSHVILILTICFLMLKLLHLQADYQLLHSKIDDEPIIIQKECVRQEIARPEKSSLNSDLLKDLMYTHPDDPLIRGRPFSGLETYGHILQEYLDAPTVTVDATSKNVKPQLVTGLSANHFEEHKAAMNSVFDKFPNQTIIVYDLGLDVLQLKYYRTTPNLILRKFDFSQYPEQVRWLTNMSFKVLIIKDILMEFGSCLWFDTSIEFYKNADELVDRYIYERGSSFVYYIKPAMHNPAWATHPIMYAYLPTNITRMTKQSYPMCQGGATVTVNTEELKHKIIKYAIACALTFECIAPNYPVSELRLEWGTRYNPYGDFEIRHCDKKNAPGRPYNCHRFDQSMWMILVSNAYDYNASKFRASLNDVLGAPNRTLADDKPQRPSWKLKG